jgi:hypothetical protein
VYGGEVAVVSTAPATVTFVATTETGALVKAGRSVELPVTIDRASGVQVEENVTVQCGSSVLVSVGDETCTLTGSPATLRCDVEAPETVTAQQPLDPTTLTFDGMTVRVASRSYRCSSVVTDRTVEAARRADDDTLVLSLGDLRLAVCRATGTAGPMLEGALGAVSSAVVVPGASGTLADATSVLLSRRAQRACASVGGTPNHLRWCVNVAGDRGARAIALQSVEGVGVEVVRIVYSDGTLGSLSLADGDLTLGTAATSCLLPPSPESADTTAPALFVDGCHDGSNLTGHYFVATIGSSLVHGGRTVPRTPLWSTPTPGPIVATAESLGVEPRLEILADKKTVLTKAGGGALLAVASLADSQLTVLVFNKVTGALLHSVEESSVSGSVRLAAGGHRVFYSYWHATTHRTQLCALELFEGRVESSCLAVPVEVDALAVSRTRFGVTRRALLIATRSGVVYAVPELTVSPLHGKPSKFLALPPRTSLGHEVRLPGGVHLLTSQPAHFESTSYAVAAGPTGVLLAAHAPSGSFDRLADNSAFFLATVMAALAAAAAWSANAVKAKALTDAWTKP